ncbi:hypothetical protein [Halomarina oriensis]|nr:hypothetical protein [Halomarina oriensis]
MNSPHSIPYDDAPYAAAGDFEALSPCPSVTQCSRHDERSLHT